MIVKLDMQGTIVTVWRSLFLDLNSNFMHCILEHPCVVRQGTNMNSTMKQQRQENDTGRHVRHHVVYM